MTTEKKSVITNDCKKPSEHSLWVEY